MLSIDCIQPIFIPKFFSSNQYMPIDLIKECGSDLEVIERERANQMMRVLMTNMKSEAMLNYIIRTNMLDCTQFEYDLSIIEKRKRMVNVTNHEIG